MEWESIGRLLMRISLSLASWDCRMIDWILELLMASYSLDI
jgi:hypothetical protein